MLNRIKILLYIFIFAGVVNCGKKQESFTQKKLFDFNWKFYRGNISNAYKTDFADHGWRDIDLPHNWKNDQKFYGKMPNGLNIASSSETGWYRKHFEIPKNWTDKHILIDFEGISDQNTIYVNGLLIDSPQRNNDSFQTLLNPYLNYKGKNVIAVCVTISKQTEKTREIESGIYKHVWLVIKDPQNYRN
jgi:beta-galactosidase